MGTITSLGLWLCVFNLFCVISHHYVWIPLLQRDLIGLATPTVWQSWTMLRFENAAGGCWWTVTHSADTLCSCSRTHTHTSTGIFTLPGIPLDTCAVFQKPFRNVHVATCRRIINYFSNCLAQIIYPALKQCHWASWKLPKTAAFL